MMIATDTKHLYARLSAPEIKQIDSILAKYKPKPSLKYHFTATDKTNGVFIRHQPKLRCANYSTNLQFHGYSHDSPLLKEIFRVVPLQEWLVKRLDVSCDLDIPKVEIHAIHPPKPARTTLWGHSTYMGGKTSRSQLLVYDKQAQQWERHRIKTDTWTRVELRFRFKPMKRVGDLTMKDFQSAGDYTILTDLTQLPTKEREIVDRLNRGEMAWRDVTRTMKGKIKEYGNAQGTNLYALILHQRDIASFIYQERTNQHQRIS